jgi:hypothetical protein
MARSQRDPSMGCRRLLALFMATALHTAFAADGSGWTSGSWLDRFHDGEDGQLDLSDWLLHQKGFLPVPLLITEPAIGYGGGVAVAFFRESLGDGASRARESGRIAPPDIYGLALLGTENGTRGGGAGGMVSFDDDRYRWRGGIAKAKVNLDFYGHGGEQAPLGYSLDGWGTVQHAMMRVGRSDAWLVAKWIYSESKSSFGDGDLSRFGPIERAARASGLGASLEFDSRNTIFTPSSGWTGALDLTLYDPSWGSDTEFQSYRGHLFGYWPISRTWVLGARLAVRLAEGDAPFYMLPFIDLRGVPAMRLQDTRTAVTELELRWNLTSRWAAIGFLGSGRAWGRDTSFHDGGDTVSKGAGFRYQLARKLGLWAGIDWAWSTQGQAWYLQIGSAWR